MSSNHAPNLKTALAGVRPARGRISAAALLRFASAGAALSIPWSAGIAMQAMGSESVPPSEALAAAGLMLAAVGGYVTFDFASTTVLATVRHRSLAELRTVWFDRLQRTPMDEVDTTSRHDWLTLLTQDASRIINLCVDLPVHAGFAIVLISGAFAMMASLSFPLACITLAAAPLAYIAARVIAAGIARVSGVYRSSEVALVTHTDQTFGALSIIKSFAAEDARTSRYDALAADAASHGIRQQRFSALLGPLTQFVAFASVVVLALLGRLWFEPLDVPELTSFILYGLLLSVGLRSVAATLGAWSDGRAALDRFAKASRVKPEVSEGRRLETIRGDLELHAIEFGYEGRPAVFGQGASLRLRAGDTAVLVGENGAGKSTLVALLLRFRTPTAGTVRLDGVDVSTLDLHWYRRQFAVVHQDPVLIDGTLRENVTFGRPDASDAMIAQVCEAALLTELIDALPHGLETRVGDHGMQLSGGQRQRVALARAFLVDAPILILDEATSMFDPESEERFIETNRARLAEKTVLWITHGTAPIDVADRIIEVRHGSFRAPLRPVEAHG